MSPRVRFRPGDHFTRKCTVHLPDCFEKIEKDRSVRPIDLASPPILNLSKRILYNDPHLIVLNKPANLCCQVVGFSSLSPSRPQPRSTASTLFCTRSFPPISSIPCIVWIGSPLLPCLYRRTQRGSFWWRRIERRPERSGRRSPRATSRRRTSRQGTTARFRSDVFQRRA